MAIFPESKASADFQLLSARVIYYRKDRAPLAQLDRASGYEPEGREFESLRARHKIQEVRAAEL